MLKSELKSNDVYIKWPNDIYYRDKKICGILIENVISGYTIDRSIVGIGINVNQTDFLSDAPNPISMSNIAGHTFDLELLLEEFVTMIVDDFDAYEAEQNPTMLAAKYRFMMWRGEGFWPYTDNLTNEKFEARIAAVAPSGHLTLAKANGQLKTYAFKEVSAIL